MDFLVIPVSCRPRMRVLMVCQLLLIGGLCVCDWYVYDRFHIKTMSMIACMMISFGNIWLRSSAAPGRPYSGFWRFGMLASAVVIYVPHEWVHQSLLGRVVDGIGFLAAFAMLWVVAVFLKSAVAVSEAGPASVDGNQGNERLGLN